MPLRIRSERKRSLSAGDLDGTSDLGADGDRDLVAVYDGTAGSVDLNDGAAIFAGTPQRVGLVLRRPFVGMPT